MTDLLPDLQPLKGAFPPAWELLTDCRITKDDPDIASPNYTLRFSNGVANFGKGTLELLRGQEKVLDDGDKVAPARQRIYTDSGSTFREKDVGQFSFHAEGH